MTQDMLGQLRAAFDPMVPVFVLVDPTLRDPLPEASPPCETQDELQATRERAWDRSIGCIELREQVPLPRHLHPYVVQLHGLDDPWLETTLDMALAERSEWLDGGLEGTGAAAHHIGGWLQSSLFPAQVAQLLMRLMTVNTDAFTRKNYLCVADRRVLALLRHVVGDKRIMSALPRVQRWLHLDAQGHLGTLQGITDSEDHTPQWLRLTSSEWAAMEKGESIARSLALALGEFCNRELLAAMPGHVLSRPAAALYGPATEALVHAEQASRRWAHRFAQAEDQLIWAALALLYPALLHSSAASQLMMQTGTPQEPADRLRYLQPDLCALLDAERKYEKTS